jgi:hypothetical protein
MCNAGGRIEPPISKYQPNDHHPTKKSVQKPEDNVKSGRCDPPIVQVYKHVLRRQNNLYHWDLKLWRHEEHRHHVNDKEKSWEEKKYISFFPFDPWIKGISTENVQEWSIEIPT